MSAGIDLDPGGQLSMTVGASSVTLTKNARMFNSMSSMRSPGGVARRWRSRSATASCVIVASASGPIVPAVRVPLMPTMSASRAAIDSTRRPPPPISSGGCGPLHRERLAVVVGDRVVRAGERERAVGQRALDHRQRLLEAVDAHAGRVVGDAGRS